MNDLTYLGRKDIEAMDKVPRLKLVNSLSGFKSANLIGTISSTGIENLAIFSSVIHIGSNPPLVGCLVRPLTVPRDTYQNIRETGWYTVNHVNSDIYENAHRTSGNYPGQLSEFNQCELTSWYSEDCPAPYVLESRVRIGLKPVEEYHIKANGTRFLVGSVEEVWFAESNLEEDGLLDIEKAGTVAVSGLDAYHSTHRLAKMGYFRIREETSRDSGF